MIHAGTNTLAINLELARKRLLAHPWIREADISRELPAKIVISIKEQVALAAVDFGERFLMNEQGKVFKKQVTSDQTMIPDHLPVISGLELSDLDLESKSRSPSYQAVMEILRLGQKEQGILPNRFIDHIHVDKDIGLSLSIKETNDLYPLRTIKLGFNNYAEKYDRLKDLISYFKTIDQKKKERLTKLDSVDLNHTHRIVVKPCKDFIARQG